MRNRTLVAALATLMFAAVATPAAQAAKTPACGDLGAGSARAAGERFMERMLGSAPAHDSMDRTMAAMMGADGLKQAHEMMGRSALGCPAGTVPAGMTRMMGAMGAMAGMMGGGSSYVDGMMGQRGSGMMGGQSVGDDGWDAADTIMVVLMALLVAAALAALAVFVRRGVRPPGADGPTSQPSVPA